MEKESSLLYSPDKPLFVLGAGFSKAVANLPTLSELSKEVRDEITERLKDEMPWKIRGKGLTKLGEGDKQGFENILKKAGDNIEGWLIHTTKNGMKALSDHIKDCIRDILDVNINSQLVENWKNWGYILSCYMKQEGASVLTFNYDDVLEQLLIQNQEDIYEFYKPFSIERCIEKDENEYPQQNNHVQVLKLHGSINCFHSGDFSKEDEPVYYCSVNERVNKLGKCAKNLVPFIVCPEPNKDERYYKHFILDKIHEKAKELIKEASKIIFIGYSLPDTDMEAMEKLFSDSKAEITIVTEDFDEKKHEKSQKRKDELLNRYKKLFKNNNVSENRVCSGLEEYSKLESKLGDIVKSLGKDGNATPSEGFSKNLVPTPEDFLASFPEGEAKKEIEERMRCG